MRRRNVYEGRKEKERGKRYSFSNCQIDRCNYQRIVNDNRSAIVNMAQKVIMMYFYVSLFFPNFFKFFKIFFSDVLSILLAKRG